MTVRKGGDIHVLGFLGKLLADEAHPFIHQGSPRWLEKVGAGHGPAVVFADEELEQFPGSLGVFGPGVDAEAIGRGQRCPASGPCRERGYPYLEVGSGQDVFQCPGAIFHHGHPAGDEGLAC